MIPFQGIECKRPTSNGTSGAMRRPVGLACDAVHFHAGPLPRSVTRPCWPSRHSTGRAAPFIVRTEVYPNSKERRSVSQVSGHCAGGGLTRSCRWPVARLRRSPAIIRRRNDRQRQGQQVSHEVKDGILGRCAMRKSQAPVAQERQPGQRPRTRRPPRRYDSWGASASPMVRPALPRAASQ